MSLSLRKVFKPSERTRSEALLYVMDHSRAGAVVQMFIMDALDKHYQPNAAAQHRPGETNMEVLQRLMQADRALGREMAFDAVLTQARGCVAQGAEAVTKAFEESGAANMINPLAWLRAAEDAKAALEIAQPEPPPEADMKPADITLRVVLRDAGRRVCETFEAPAAEAIERAARFMINHGTDPDEDGEAAQAGSISFEPV